MRPLRFVGTLLACFVACGCHDKQGHLDLTIREPSLSTPPFDGNTVRFYGGSAGSVRRGERSYAIMLFQFRRETFGKAPIVQTAIVIMRRGCSEPMQQGHVVTGITLASAGLPEIRFESVKDVVWSDHNRRVSVPAIAYAVYYRWEESNGADKAIELRKPVPIDNSALVEIQLPLDVSSPEDGEGILVKNALRLDDQGRLSFAPTE